MACCLIAATILAMLHRLTPWRRRQTDIAEFAPVALRTAPGVKPAAATLSELPPRPAPLDIRLGLVAWTLRFCSLGACIYLVLVALLVRTGIVHSSAPTATWVLRTGCVILLAGAATIAAARLLGRGQDRSTRRQIAGCAAVGFGLVLFESMLVDMHILSLFTTGGLAFHSAFHTGVHAVSVVLLVTGVLLAMPAPQSVPPSPVVSLGG
jgi:hypothetical protein